MIGNALGLPPSGHLQGSLCLGKKSSHDQRVKGGGGGAGGGGWGGGGGQV